MVALAAQSVAWVALQRELSRAARADLHSDAQQQAARQMRLMETLTVGLAVKKRRCGPTFDPGDCGRFRSAPRSHTTSWVAVAVARARSDVSKVHGTETSAETHLYDFSSTLLADGGFARAGVGPRRSLDGFKRFAPLAVRVLAIAPLLHVTACTSYLVVGGICRFVLKQQRNFKCTPFAMLQCGSMQANVLNASNVSVKAV